MEINIEKVINPKLEKNKINVKIEVPDAEQEITNLMQYIKNFEKTKIVATEGNELKSIEIREILYFYSDKKYNYCKSTNGEFKIKSKLYELEKADMNFLRISKSCVVNIQNVKCFDFGETGKIIVKFRDGSEQPVSRRKIRDVMNYLEERRI